MNTAKQVMMKTKTMMAVSSIGCLRFHALHPRQAMRAPR
jgi:hypothetical protein